MADLTNRVVPLMKAQASGDIVNLASTSGMKGAKGGTAYAASKWAVRGMSQCWQAELRPHGIRVVCILPSEVQTNWMGKTGRNNTYRNNLVYQNARYDWQLKNGLTHTGTVSSAPLFVDNSRAASPSLKLSASSPAVGRATPTHAESTDFAGRPRDARAGYDIGALQH